MKAFACIVIAGFCSWLFWILLSDLFFKHARGSLTWGGLPLEDRAALHDFLAQHGFTSIPATNQPDVVVERFQGSVQDSRRIFVTVIIQATNTFGISVGVDYDFRGFVNRVDKPVAEARKFEDTLTRWLNKHRMKRIHAIIDRRKNERQQRQLIQPGDPAADAGSQP